MAYFSAFELKAYEKAGWTPMGNVLDLGCSDGTFAVMLKKLMGYQAHLTGLDIQTDALKRAVKTGLYEIVVKADASSLPFMDETFDNAMSNAVLYCLRPGPLEAMQEVARVLKPNGEFAFTVPTHLVAQHYYFSDWLTGLGLKGLAKRYRYRVNTRLKNVSCLPIEEWKVLTERSGFEVEKLLPYISSQISRTWSIYLEIPRVASLLKLVPFENVRWISARLQWAMMRQSYEKYSLTHDCEYGDYVLIIARKL